MGKWREVVCSGVEAGRLLCLRLARSRSPKPLGFGAGEAQRKCVCGNEKVLDAHQAAEPGAGAKTRLRKRLVLEAARTRASPRRWLRAKRKLLFV